MIMMSCLSWYKVEDANRTMAGLSRGIEENVHANNVCSMRVRLTATAWRFARFDPFEHRASLFLSPGNFQATCPAGDLCCIFYWVAVETYLGQDQEDQKTLLDPEIKIACFPVNKC